MQVKTISQANLTPECWNVQVWGLEKCKTCEYRKSKECGGKNIRKTGKNAKGLTVPIN